MREARQLAQSRAYDRWEREMRRRHRSRLNEEAPSEGDQDLTTLEHLATENDMSRLNELLREELSKVGQRP